MGCQVQHNGTIQTESIYWNLICHTTTNDFLKRSPTIQRKLFEIEGMKNILYSHTDVVEILYRVRQITFFVLENDFKKTTEYFLKFLF